MYINTVFLKRSHLILLGVTAHLLAVVFSSGYHQCDELFQVFEFAGYKLGINTPESLPWEFDFKMRSALPPLLVFVVTKLAYAVQINDPFIIALLLRLFMAAVSMMAFIRLLKLQTSDSLVENDKMVLWTLALIWWSLPYFHVRLSAENISATLFLWAYVLNQEYGSVFKKWILPGMLMALAFHVRFQIAFMILPYAAWLLFIQYEKLKAFLSLLMGFIFGFLFATITDYWLYGEFKLSWWNYIYQNIFEAKANQFGVEPFYYYITESIAHLIPPFSVLIIAGLIFFWWKERLHAVTWITLPFVLIHFFVGHKEFRFLFPIMNFIPFMLVIARRDLLRYPFFKFLSHRLFIRLFVVCNLAALLIFCLSPADSATRKMRKLYYLQTNGIVKVLIHGESPYSNNLGLNYFHNPRVQCYNDTLHNAPPCNWYYTEDFIQSDTVVANGTTYVRNFSSIPRKAALFDFNGWMSRVPYFSIYKAQTP